MQATYMKRSQKLSHALKNTNLVEHERIDKHNTFSRKRKMSLEDILLSCLARKGLTTTLELRKYFKQKEDLSMEISKQGYLQQRKQLNPDIFTYLNDQYLMDFYNSSEICGTVIFYLELMEAKRKCQIQKRIGCISAKVIISFLDRGKYVH